MSAIRILSEKVASQIAAGEVVERPGSIVRELLDNSIDAGADRILVQVKHGGKVLVKVTDNGCGMGKDDLLLCLERHATSKIGEIKDLFSIKTLGFREKRFPAYVPFPGLRSSLANLINSSGTNSRPKEGTSGPSTKQGRLPAPQWRRETFSLIRLRGGSFSVRKKRKRITS